MKRNYGTKINVEAQLSNFPRKAHEYDAAYDLCVAKSVELKPHSRVYASLGFKVQLPSNIKLNIMPRSGQSGKGMIVHVEFPVWLGGGAARVRVNSDVLLGLVDCGYGEDVKAIVKSGRWRMKHRIMRLIGFRFFLYPGDRICQGAFTYVPQINLEKGKVLGTRGGLGSTDKQL